MTTELTVSESRPAFLEKFNSTKGTEGLADKIRPSFVKIVQKNANDELLAKFKPGDLILTPDHVLLAADGEVVPFTPLMWYTEYCKWSANSLRGIEPMITERSFDPNSPVAIKSMSSATWSEEHPKYQGQPKYNYRYCEHMNFIVKFMSEELAHLEPAVISFVKTNYSVGQRLAKLILQRRAAMFAGVYELGRRVRENQENSWRIFTVDNYSGGSWVKDENICKQLEAAHDYYEDLQKKRMIDVYYDESVVDEADEVTRESVY